MVIVPAAGSTVILVPVPAGVSPHDPVNHSQTAPAPSEPPDTVKVLEDPLQVLLFNIVTPVGAVDWLRTVTGKDDGELIPQLLDAVTLTFPFWPDDPVVTVIVVVPCPEVIAHPAGTVHA